MSTLYGVRGRMSSWVCFALSCFSFVPWEYFWKNVKCCFGCLLQKMSKFQGVKNALTWLHMVRLTQRSTITSLWLQGDSRAKWTYRFFKKSWPLFWRSHSFLRKSTYLFTDIFKDNLDIVEDNRKKSQISHVEIIISVFFISITIRCTTT